MHFYDKNGLIVETAIVSDNRELQSNWRIYPCHVRSPNYTVNSKYIYYLDVLLPWEDVYLL